MNEISIFDQLMKKGPKITVSKSPYVLNPLRANIALPAKMKNPKIKESASHHVKRKRSNLKILIPDAFWSDSSTFHENLKIFKF